MTPINTIIIGAGAAGLAVGACQKRAEVSAVILEQSDKVGAKWGGHYDRLHFPIDKCNLELPFALFSKNARKR